MNVSAVSSEKERLQNPFNIQQYIPLYKSTDNEDSNKHTNVHNNDQLNSCSYSQISNESRAGINIDKQSSCISSDENHDKYSEDNFKDAEKVKLKRFLIAIVTGLIIAYALLIIYLVCTISSSDFTRNNSSHHAYHHGRSGHSHAHYNIHHHGHGGHGGGHHG